MPFIGAPSLKLQRNIRNELELHGLRSQLLRLGHVSTLSRNVRPCLLQTSSTVLRFLVTRLSPMQEKHGGSYSDELGTVAIRKVSCSAILENVMRARIITSRNSLRSFHIVVQAAYFQQKPCSLLIYELRLSLNTQTQHVPLKGAVVSSIIGGGAADLQTVWSSYESA